MLWRCRPSHGEYRNNRSEHPNHNIHPKHHPLILSAIIVTSIAILAGVIYGAVLGYYKAAGDNRREHTYMKAVNENLQHRINALEKEKSLIQEALDDALQFK